ncbi:DUF2800 domain-containing protein [Bradyrhizobium sp. 33ap4]|uniref:DUF2800 domain-containing protein n=1 Tax=Bradyrhizobium sp. 33ap4 TaxID=3061630 RepID=UPI00292F9200|nr:DUF2800 domain-containing protein [Bradyrhizobium sp. 33ap4]
MTASADHGSRDHATWSASATARNWLCSGAIALNIRNRKPEVESEASAWGTACHQLSEKCFKTGKDADEFIGTVEATKQRKIEVDEELAETAQVYVDYVRKRIEMYFLEHREEPTVIHEQALPLDRLGGPFDAGGTGDTVMFFPKWRLIEIVDLKGGRGVVEAADNKQLRTYGLGSLLANRGLNVDKVMTTIVQPRAPHKNGRIRSETFHVADLVEWTAELVERMKLSKQALDEFDTTPFAAWWAKWLTPGSCKFCPQEGSCPALKQKALDAAHVWFDDLDQPKISNSPAFDTPEMLAQDLDMLDMISDWINARRAYAHSQAEAGVTIPGYVLVPKEKREVWNEGVEDVVRAAAVSAGIAQEKYLNPAKLKTPKQVRKALGKKESMVAGLSNTPSGGTNLVRADKTTREAIPSAVDRFFTEV